MRSVNRWLSLCAALSLLAAVCARTSMAASCSVTAASLEFGTLTALQGSVDAIGRITVSCQGMPGEHVDYSLTLSRGSGSFGQRVLMAGAQPLAYNLFVDAARLTLWGDGTAGTEVLSAGIDLGGPVVSQQHVVYARVVPLKTTLPGSYGDTIAVTLNYEQ